MATTQTCWLAVLARCYRAVAIGLINGLLVAVLELNALIVTLAVGAITSGVTLWYRESLPAESRVPPAMAAWGGSRLFGLNVSVWVATILVIAADDPAAQDRVGRRFVAVGANPRAAWIAGINVSLYQTAAFTVAALLYGIAGILLSAFIRNPTLRVGDPYLLAPLAAAVLGGTAISRWRRQHGGSRRRGIVPDPAWPVAQDARFVHRIPIRHPRYRHCPRHDTGRNETTTAPPPASSGRQDHHTLRTRFEVGVSPAHRARGQRYAMRHDPSRRPSQA